VLPVYIPHDNLFIVNTYYEPSAIYVIVKIKHDKHNEICSWYHYFPLGFARIERLFNAHMFSLIESLSVYGENGCLLYSYTFSELEKIKNNTYYISLFGVSWYGTLFLLNKDSITATSNTELYSFKSKSSLEWSHPFNPSFCKTEPGVKPNGFNASGWLGPELCK
jgi:hypothetical protein